MAEILMEVKAGALLFCYSNINCSFSSKKKKVFKQMVFKQMSLRQVKTDYTMKSGVWGIGCFVLVHAVFATKILLRL